MSFSGEDEFVFDDGLVKDEQQVLINPDLEDTLGPYLPGNCPSLAENRTDVGRARHEGLLRAVYGSTEAEVRRALVEVEFLGKRLTVHQRIAPALQRVAQASRALIVERDELRPYFARLGGGFRWRTVEGTDRLSPHAFGIAVDLDPKGAAYWRWNSAWNGEYPRAIVEAFEAQGFIWGGNWEHFDSMHFEYRPELLDERCSDSHR